MTRFGRVLRVLAGRSDKAVIDALIGQLESAKAGAELAIEMISGLARAEAHTRMEEIEHNGDVERSLLVEVLSHSLATPIDREDLFRVSRSIDDVLDSLRDFVRESHLYRINDQSRFEPMLKSVLEGIDALELAVMALSKDSAAVTRNALDAKKAGGAIGRAYQYEIAYLFGDEMSSERMKSRELVRRLEIVGINLGEAADGLTDGAMKRWH